MDSDEMWVRLLRFPIEFIIDHASWTQAGVSSVAVFEGTFEDQSPFIHSVRDTVDNIDFKHMAAFVRTVLGFVLEMGHYDPDE